MSRGMTPKGVRAWKNFEREVVRALSKLAPSARRCLQYQRDHGMPDVIAGVLWVECKSGKQHRPVERVYRETVAKTPGRRSSFVPAVVTKAGRRKVVTLALADFVRIAGAPNQVRRQMWKGGQP